MEADYRGLMAGIRTMNTNLPGIAFRHAIKCRKNLTRIITDDVRERKSHRIQKHDFMQILINSTDADRSKLGEAEIIQNILLLILGGYESTSNVFIFPFSVQSDSGIFLEGIKPTLVVSSTT